MTEVRSTLSDMTTVDEYGVPMLRPETEPVPESDEHARIVDLLFAGLAARFIDGDIVVTERMAWFPDQDDTKIRLDPGVMVIFGRPKQHRVSYKAWAEDGVAPSVIIEVKSPKDTSHDYDRRLGRAVHYGVTEVLLIDPFAPGGVVASHLQVEPGVGLRTVAVSASTRSPLTVESLGITLTGGDDLVVTDEYGVWLDTVAQILANRSAGTKAREESARAEQEAARAQQEAARAERLTQALRDAGIDPADI